MIETVCACGADLKVPEKAVGSAMPCKSCGQRIRIAAAEVLPPGAGAGDFDARLIIAAGPNGVNDTIALGGITDIEIGKTEDRPIMLPGTMVSRAHAKLVRIDFGPSRWKLIDTKSRNGVLVNNQKISEVELKNGDTLKIGEYTLRYSTDMPEPAAPPPPKDAVRCPGCGTSYSAKTIICTTCGINIKTGKTLITSRAFDENDIAIRADTWIRIISWFIWFGLFPIASEAYATHKPRATWIITGITIFVSLLFLVAILGNQGEVPTNLQNFMLWVGKPETAQADADQIIKPTLPPSGGTPSATDNRNMDELVRELNQIGAEDRPVGQFHVYQLLTNTLLHAGLMHLAGNLVFLLVFGLRVNELIGDVKMWIVYPTLAICSGGIYAIAEWNQPLHPALGASGAIMGLAGMYFVFFPLHRVHMAIWLRGGLLTRWRVFYKLFRMQGYWLLGLWVLLNDVLPTVIAAMGSEGSTDRVAHWAHLGGFVSGVVIALGLLISRQVNAHGADILSVMLGPRAWGLIGKPANRKVEESTSAM